MATYDNIEDSRRPEHHCFNDDLSEQIRKVLDAFDGEPSLKRLFWEILSYDRVREELPRSFLPPSATAIVTDLEVFASSAALTVVYVAATNVPDGTLLEQTSWTLKRHVFNCVVLLHDPSGWSLVYPDELKKPRVRLMMLPGPLDQRAATVRALAALNAADESSSEGLTVLEVADSMDTFFPGVMPNLNDLLNDFERIAKHPNAEVRDVLPFVREAGKYPLLTARQERGEDITGEEVVPEGSGLNYQECRLVCHNLRLVFWMARKYPRMGMELSDMVQEGVIGLLIAARRYKPDLGHRFSTYAFHWVRQTMMRALHNKCNLIRWPDWRAPELITANLKGEDEGFGAGERAVLSVPSPLSFASLPMNDPVESLAREEASDAIHEVLAGLKPIQKEVIMRRFGIGCSEEYTLEEIGQRLGLTRERIRQIEAGALRRLRGPLGKELTIYNIASQWRVQRNRGYANVRISPRVRDKAGKVYTFSIDHS